jgi:replication initiation and membrane attachment protein
MKEVNPTDLYEVRALTLLSDVDRSVLVDLYEPLIGARALSVFLTLWNEDKDVTRKHEDALRRTMLSAGEWLSALKALEAVALVGTYYQRSEKFSYFVYCLYSPKLPSEFFDNALFAGTLRKIVGENFAFLAKRYSVGAVPLDFENVSESFVDFFSPDFGDHVYAEQFLPSGGHLVGEVKTGFDYNVFFAELKAKDGRYASASFSKEETSRVERLATLYGYDESTMADFVVDHFAWAKPLGERLDAKGLEKDADKSVRFSYLHQIPAKKSDVHDDGSLAHVIKAMEKFTPVQFLTMLQKGHKPAGSDLELLRELTIDMGLSNQVANALVFYVLTKNDNVLSTKFTEKIAASLVRENVQTAIDAMNYFSRTTYRKTSGAKIQEPISAVPDVSSQKPEERISDADFEKLISNLHNNSKKGK